MNLSALLQSTRRSLRRFGAANPDVEAELILGHVLGLKRAHLYLDPGRAITAEEEAQALAILDARSRRYPLQYVLGEIEFMGLPLMMREGVFIPRPETEILVESLLARIGGARAGGAGAAPEVLDLGTGSGAIAIALAKHLSAARVVATDMSVPAVGLARENARLNLVADRVALVAADGLAAIARSAAGHFDILVSNPPYIPTGEIESLQPEVRDFEPRLALDGGDDGLRFIAGTLSEIPSILKSGGIVAFEIGATQGRAVSGLLEGAGLGGIEVLKDLAGRDRVAIGRRMP